MEDNEEPKVEKKEIPQISISGNIIESSTFNIPIGVNGQTEYVVVKKLLAGKRRDIMKRHLVTNIRGQQMNAEITDAVGLQIDILASVIIKAPFDFTEAGLNNLTEDTIDYLYNAYQDWDGKKKLNG